MRDLPRGSVGVDVARLEAMAAQVRAGSFVKVTSILVARHGRLAFEAYFGGCDEHSVMNTRSATKTIAGMLTGIAIDLGRLNGVDAPVVPFFPELQPVARPDPRKDAMTVQDLLTMSSCLACDDREPLSPGNEERMYPLADWVRFTIELPVRAGARAFHYCTAGTVLLGALLERAVGEALPDFADRRLFGPLGIADAAWQLTPTGGPMTGGGLGLRSRDLLKLGLLYWNRGEWEGRQVVAPAWVSESTRAHVRVDADTEYGYLWWLRHGGYLMQGNGGNKVAVLPDQDLVAVITSTNYGARDMHRQTDELLTDHILAALT
jgi:CubicO group peptidase (beta-lactamase class C family)